MRAPLLILTVTCAFVSCLPAWADENAVSKHDEAAAWAAAAKAETRGPADVALKDQARLHLTSDMAFIPPAQANVLLRSWGNGESPNLVGMIVSPDDSKEWVITIDFTADGYIKDDDAKNWKADEMLQSFKDGTETQNAERLKMGVPPLDITGWVQAPDYDASTHRLAWSLAAVERGAATDEPSVVNYNTYALGRDGYFEIDLLTNSQRVEDEKRYVRAALNALEYKPGKTYTDYNAATDKLAEYGIAALVGGVVAKKLGLLALAGVFVVKFIKVIAVGAAVVGGTIMKLFRGKKAPDA
jgi:uncharacterized membrane-anchored protein